MKKVLSIFLVLAMLFPYFVYPNKVEGQTFGELKKELEKFEQDYIANKNKQQLTKDQIEQTKENILNTSIEIENIGKNIVEIKKQIEELNIEIYFWSTRFY